MGRSLKHLSESVGLRIAHISDLHFGYFTLSPLQFFSKRFVGNIHLGLSRCRTFAPKRLFNLFAEALKTFNVDLVVITGDLTTTTHKKELALALDLFHELEESGMCVLALPGNHDHYTSQAFRKKDFYDYFTNDPSPARGNFSENLENHRLEVYPIARKLWLINLDTALPTSLFASHGLFSEALEERLLHTLEKIPKKDRIVLCNHYPFIDIESRENHALRRRKALESLLKQHPQIVLYLHGHTHRHSIADLRDIGLPITCDAGSVSLRQMPTFNLINITKDGCEIEAMCGEWLSSHMVWKLFREERYSFTREKT